MNIIWNPFNPFEVQIPILFSFNNECLGKGEGP